MGQGLPEVSHADDDHWRFDVEATKPTVSVLATWNRTLESDFSAYHVPKIDMELWSVDGQGVLGTLVGDPGLPVFGAGNVRSESVKDNLEHIYLRNLEPGSYVLEVEHVVNGKGELVGVNFDRVWENVANDFGYNPDIARNVSVDIRYMLWILDEVQGAKSLLEELSGR